MIVTPTNVIEQLMTDELIVHSYVYSDKSQRYWRLKKALKVELSDGTVVKIPKDYYYDMATVPKLLWSFSPPFNDALIAFLIHDFLYVHKETHTLNRKQTDDELLFWSRITNPGSLDNYIKWFFCRVFGWMWWYSIKKKVVNLFKPIG